MKYEKIMIVEKEYSLIDDLMKKVDSLNPSVAAAYDKLREELKEAKIVPEEEMPADVVRLNSYIDIQTPTGLLEGYQLTLTPDKTGGDKKLSLITPMGSALLGYAEGDQITWSFPSGENTITLKKVYTA